MGSIAPPAAGLLGDRFSFECIFCATHIRRPHDGTPVLAVNFDECQRSRFNMIQRLAGVHASDRKTYLSISSFILVIYFSWYIIYLDREDKYTTIDSSVSVGIT